ncbi:MAG: GDSL-type esterase/lipase family protein [Planctomycetota bacterium]
MHEDRTTITTGTRPAPGTPPTAPPRRSRAALWPLVAMAGIVTTAVLLGSRPAVPPTVVDHVPDLPLTRGTVDPLPGWNDGPTKQSILAFLDTVTRPGSDTFVPVPERVAVFDHDGTLVCEKPIVHGAFLIERLREFVEKRPELAHEEPYATLLGGDIDFVRKLGKKFFADLTFSTLAGIPEEELEKSVQEFLVTARHPVFGVPYEDVTYQPMRELIELLRSRGFTVWICSGSGVHFMRPAAAAWYGIGPEHVIASRSTTEMREVETTEELPAGSSPNRRLALVVKPELEVLNDQDRKPVSIGEQIGRRPIFAAGNVGTAGDIAMLRWSQSSRRPNFQLLVLHDDAERELAYDEPTNASLTAAAQYGWHVVRMASDWKTIFAKPLQKHAAPPATAAPAAAPTPVQPAAGPPPARWEEEVSAYENLEREQPPVPGGVCLIGSSNIRLWSTLPEDFPGMNVVNRGVGGARLAELAEFAPRLVAAAKPRVIVVSAGTNDIGSGATADKVRRSFEQLVVNIRRDLPDVAIVFLAIAPSIKRWEQVDRQREANEAILTVIESGQGGQGLWLIDANAAFLGPDGKPAAECFLDDQQHPSTVGNARRAALMRPLLEELLRETPADSSSPPAGSGPG